MIYPRYLREGMKANSWRKTKVINTQRERVREASRKASKLKDIKLNYHIILESKASLEDEVDNLQSKVDLLCSLKGE